MPKGKRAPGSTQVSISLNKTLLAGIDECAAADNRSRSNWIVTELIRCVEKHKAQRQLDKGAKKVVAIEDPSSSTRSASPGDDEASAPDRRRSGAAKLGLPKSRKSPKEPAERKD